MRYARNDVEKTKKIAQKFVRYQEGAEALHSILQSPLFDIKMKEKKQY